ncbi:hypothetical protein OAN24_03245 [Pseudodesulfovibrio sp.]|nr:hypothetical protein [Pseudodesulfovibrio sp.]
MAYSIAVKQEEGILVVITTGVLDSLDDWNEARMLVFDKIHESGANKVLFDERGWDLRMDVHDLLRFVEGLNHDGVQYKGLRFACLYLADKAKLYTAYETICRNRALNYMVFQDKQKAIEWLHAQ